MYDYNLNMESSIQRATVIMLNPKAADVKLLWKVIFQETGEDSIMLKHW